MPVAVLSYLPMHSSAHNVDIRVVEITTGASDSEHGNAMKKSLNLLASKVSEMLGFWSGYFISPLKRAEHDHS